MKDSFENNLYSSHYDYWVINKKANISTTVLPSVCFGAWAIGLIWILFINFGKMFMALVFDV